MSDLASFQAAFAEGLLAEHPVGRVARQPGFSVYRNTSLHGAVEALRATYRTVDALLGGEMFAAVAVDFCRRYPPRDPVLSRFGAGFGPFLRRQPWHSELSYLADVARLDRLSLECLCAEDRARPVTCHGTVPAPRADATLRLDPATRFLWVETPAVSIWLAHQDGFDELEPEWAPEGALFIRRCGTLSVRPIDQLTHRLLVAIAAGVPLSDLATLARKASADPAALLQPLVCSGAIHLN